MEQLDNVPVSGRRYAARSSRRLMRNDEPEPSYQHYQSAVPRPPSEASSVRSAGTGSNAPPHPVLPPPIARPPPGITPASPTAAPDPADDLPPEVELSIAQRAVMERYTSNLHVQFTEEQAHALELAAIEKAMKESEREEAAMWCASRHVRPAQPSTMTFAQGLRCGGARRWRSHGSRRPHPCTAPSRNASPLPTSSRLNPGPSRSRQPLTAIYPVWGTRHSPWAVC